MKHIRKRHAKKSRRYRKKGGFGLTKSSVGVGPFKNLFGQSTKGQTALGSKEKCYSFMGKEVGCKREDKNKPPSQNTSSVDATATAPTTAPKPTKKKPWYKFRGGRKTRKRRSKRRTRRVYR